MNKFIESSKLEREKMEEVFKKLNITEYDFTDENGFDKHDGTFKGRKGFSIIYEVKNRAIVHNKFKTTVIEKAKYDYLIKTAKELGYLPMIFIFFLDGKYLAQNLKTADIEFTKKYAPRTTAGDNTKVVKEFCEITITKDNIFNL